MSTVTQLAAERRKDFESYQEHQEHFDALAQHMYDISDDPHGSEPKDYLGGEELQELNHFIGLAEELGWPDAESIIGMRSGRGRNVRWLPQLPAWEHNRHIDHAALTKRLFYPRVGEAQPGYVFAELNIAGLEQRVAVARNKKLYSLRGHELYKSKAMGWGRLPDPEYLLPAIEPVKIMLNYRPYKSLEEALVSRIHPQYLPASGKRQS